MDYINTSKISKVIMVNSIKRMVKSGETVNLTKQDVINLGIYSIFFQPINNEVKAIEKTPVIIKKRGRKKKI